MNTKAVIGSHIGNIIIFSLQQSPGCTLKGQIISDIEIRVRPGVASEGSLIIPGSWIRKIMSIREVTQ